MKAFLLGLTALVVFSGAAHAETNPADGTAWLKKMAAAAHRLNYSGTFIYQYGSHVETSRITHLLNESGEHEKLEALDGPPRETIRNNDEVQCYNPESNSVVVEKRTSRKFFPAVLPRQFDGVGNNYLIKLGGEDRIAGYSAQLVELEPKDNFRYRHRFWVERDSGLLLKTVILNEKNEPLDQAAFTQVVIGGKIDLELLKPKLSGKKQVFRHPQTEASAPQDKSWSVKQVPPGFVQVTDGLRMLPGKKFPVRHLMYSDGLSRISIFIEPLSNIQKPMRGVSGHGAINIYTRPVSKYQVTVLGDVPATAISQVGNSIEYHPGGKDK